MFFRALHVYANLVFSLSEAMLYAGNVLVHALYSDYHYGPQISGIVAGLPQGDKTQRYEEKREATFR